MMKSGLAPTKYPVGNEQSSHRNLWFCGGGGEEEKNWGKLVQVAFCLVWLNYHRTQGVHHYGREGFSLAY